MPNNSIITDRRAIESYFLGNPKLIAEKILFIKRDSRLAEYREYCSEIIEFGHVWKGFTGTLRGEKISIIASGVGPSLIGDAVLAIDKPHAICLYSGTCGGLKNDIEIGDYFISDSAVCGEGYTLQFSHVPLSVVPGNGELSKGLMALLTSRVDRSCNGLSFTTSSVVRETDPNFWTSVRKECSTIEMGAAAFYAAALATRKKAVAYYWVTDLPTRGKSFFDSPAPKDIEIKQNRYDRSVSLDLELLSHI